MVRVPTPEEEDRKRRTRERERLLKEAYRTHQPHQGAAACQGIRDAMPLKPNFLSDLERLHTVTARPAAAVARRDLPRA